MTAQPSQGGLAGHGPAQQVHQRAPITEDPSKLLENTTPREAFPSAAEFEFCSPYPYTPQWEQPFHVFHLSPRVISTPLHLSHLTAPPPLPLC